MIRLLILVFWSFVANFLFCEFGENVTSHFNELNDIIGQGEWYSLPINIQQMLPTIMVITQKQIILRGFGGIVLTREAFKTVRSFSTNQ